MPEMPGPSFIDESLMQKALASDRVAAALKKIGKHEIVKIHDDGDMTVKDSAGCFYVVTTEGQTFMEDSCECVPEMLARARDLHINLAKSGNLFIFGKPGGD